MPRIAVFGGTGYLASLIKNQNNIKRNKYTFFSRKKGTKNYINYLSLKKKFRYFKKFWLYYSSSRTKSRSIKKKQEIIRKKKWNNISDLWCMFSS